MNNHINSFEEFLNEGKHLENKPYPLEIFPPLEIFFEPELQHILLKGIKLRLIFFSYTFFVINIKRIIGYLVHLHIVLKIFLFQGRIIDNTFLILGNSY